MSTAVHDTPVAMPVTFTAPMPGLENAARLHAAQRRGRGRTVRPGSRFHARCGCSSPTPPCLCRATPRRSRRHTGGPGTRPGEDAPGAGGAQPLPRFHDGQPHGPDRAEPRPPAAALSSCWTAATTRSGPTSTRSRRRKPGAGTPRPHQKCATSTTSRDPVSGPARVKTRNGSRARTPRPMVE